MLLSMTGFGEGRSESERLAVTVELRSINNRHLKLSYRASDGYQGLESRAEAMLRKQVRRGSVQLNVRVEHVARATDYHLNGEVLQNYRQELAELAGIDPAEVPLESLLSLPGTVTTPSGIEANPEEDWPLIEAALEQALVSLGAMRSQEGQALAEDLRQNCELIEAELKQITDRSPQVAEGYRQRLEERVGQAIEKQGVALEPADLVREVALFVDRSDISEEIVRLRSHIEQFEATLDQPESGGRKLEFIAQEMGRETNTIGSKASDNEISQRVIEIKAALERVREQVQNVE